MSSPEELGPESIFDKVGAWNQKRGPLEPPIPQILSNSEAIINSLQASDRRIAAQTEVLLQEAVDSFPTPPAQPKSDTV